MYNNSGLILTTKGSDLCLRLINIAWISIKLLINYCNHQRAFIYIFLTEKHFRLYVYRKSTLFFYSYLCFPMLWWIISSFVAYKIIICHKGWTGSSNFYLCHSGFDTLEPNLTYSKSFINTSLYCHFWFWNHIFISFSISPILFRSNLLF